MEQFERKFFIQLSILAVIITLAACHRTKVPTIAPAPALAIAPTPARPIAPLALLIQSNAYHSAFDPRGGELYITDANTFKLYSVDPKAIVKPHEGRIYFTDIKERPGSVYELAGGTPKPIFNFGKVAVRVVFTHTTYVRDVGFDPSGNLYFSESSGAGGEGKIYRLDPASGTALLFYTVRLASVGGFWAGDFAFSPDGRLYLSTGNIYGGKVFRIEDPGSLSPPVNVYSIPTESVAGITFDHSGKFYYSNWDSAGHIYQLDLNTGVRKLIFSAPGRSIWGVSFP